MIAPARVAAFRALTAIDLGRFDLGSALDRARQPLSDPRDRSLATDIVTGTLRWQNALDWAIERFADRTVASLDPAVRLSLRMAAYQLLRLSRVPASAVVSDAVELVRQHGAPRAAGFVNAVLRRLAREASGLAWPERPADGPNGPHSQTWRAAALDYLSITASHPRWLVERWLDQHGFAAADARVTFNNRPAPLTLRAYTGRVTRDELARRLAEQGVVTRETQYAPHGLIVVEGSPFGTAAAREGLFAVQDEASQLVVCALGPRPRERVLDACAAPGGKAVAMAEAIQPGRLVAADLRRRRVGLLSRTVSAAGLANVSVVRADTSRSLPFAALFDAVLVDAPCSGLGTIRRDPDIRWRRDAPSLARYATVQRRMLDEAARVVRPGGRLLYATCSSEPDENLDVVESFLADHPGYRRALPPTAQGGSDQLAALRNEAGDLETSPERHGLENFYGALLTSA